MDRKIILHNEDLAKLDALLGDMPFKYASPILNLLIEALNRDIEDLNKKIEDLDKDIVEIKKNK